MANNSPTMRWPAEVGINHVGAYEVSGRPFASGNINASAANITIEFPFVTRWVEIINDSGKALKVGFSENGLSPGTNYFEVHSGSSGRLEMKISNLYLRGGDSGTTSVVAGLTSINKNKTSGSIGPSWSGSIGVR
jgi:hypothetical protein